MGQLRDAFWELPIGDLNRDEWEALCDGCGHCCTHKMEDADTGEIEHTNVACKLLDTQTAQCSDYRNRKAFVPDCLRLTLSIVEDVPWLPTTCAYRIRAAGRPLPSWHYLISGDREAVKRVGVSVAGRVVSETEAGRLNTTSWNGARRSWTISPRLKVVSLLAHHRSAALSAKTEARCDRLAEARRD